MKGTPPTGETPAATAVVETAAVTALRSIAVPRLATLFSPFVSAKRKTPASQPAFSIKRRRRRRWGSVVRVPVRRREDLPARVVDLRLHADHAERPEARLLPVLLLFDHEAVDFEVVV